MARGLFDVVRGMLLLDETCDPLVAHAGGSRAGVALTGRTGAFAELVERVASEANAEIDRRRRRLLNEACTELDAVLAAE